MLLKSKQAFTLAELLIALAVLGVIATFTIPKVLQSTSSSHYNSTAKEAFGMISSAFQNYKLNSTLTTNTIGPDLTPYMNYVRVDTTSIIDIAYSVAGTMSCATGSHTCLLLHSGAMLRYVNTMCFYGSTNLNAITFDFDPDGKVTGDASANTEGKAISIWLYYNGGIRDRGTILANTVRATGGCAGSAVYQPNPSVVAPWFSWSN